MGALPSLSGVFLVVRVGPWLGCRRVGVLVSACAGVGAIGESFVARIARPRAGWKGGWGSGGTGETGTFGAVSPGPPRRCSFPVPKARRGMCVCRAITLRLGIFHGHVRWFCLRLPRSLARRVPRPCFLRFRFGPLLVVAEGTGPEPRRAAPARAGVALYGQCARDFAELCGTDGGPGAPVSGVRTASREDRNLQCPLSCS